MHVERQIAPYEPPATPSMPRIPAGWSQEYDDEALELLAQEPTVNRVIGTMLRIHPHLKAAGNEQLVVEYLNHLYIRNFGGN